MPNVYVQYDDLKEFIRLAIKAEITWFKPRKLLWEEFKNIVDTSVSGYDAWVRGEMVKIPFTLYISIKGVLLSRSQDLTSDKILAFETSLSELDELAEKSANNETKTSPKAPRREPKRHVFPKHEEEEIIEDDTAEESDPDELKKKSSNIPIPPKPPQEKSGGSKTT